MRVRLQTSPMGMLGRIILLVILGGAAFAVVQQTDWYKTNVTAHQPSAAEVQPAPAPTPIPGPTPLQAAAPVRAVHRSIPVPAGGETPPGWTNFLGILIPPPGWNDR